MSDLNFTANNTLNASAFPFEDPAIFSNQEKWARFTVQFIQLVVGFFGNVLSLSVLAVYRHYLSHPFWFYLVSLCSVDLIGCLTYLIEIEDPLDIYHKFFDADSVNRHFESWVRDMISDLSAWLIVFIAIERWKNVCWNHRHNHHHYDNHLCTSHHQNRPPTSNYSPTSMHHFGVFGLASFKRRTAQLETCIVVAGALMCFNAINYFALVHHPLPRFYGDRMDAFLNLTDGNATNATFVAPPSEPMKPLSTDEILASHWSKAWPVFNQVKKCWLPAVILLVLNSWIVIHTIRFLWLVPAFPAVKRRLTLRRLSSMSAPQTQQHLAGTQSTLISSASPLAPSNNNNNNNSNNHNNSANSFKNAAQQQPTPLQMLQMYPLADEQEHNKPNQQPSTRPPATIAYSRNRARRRRRLVLAWLTLLALPTIFIALTLPHSIFKIVGWYTTFGRSPEDFRTYLTLDWVFDWLAKCNHTVNCFIYCLTIAKFRLALRRMFYSMVPCIRQVIVTLRKKPSTESDQQEHHCQLVSFIERARKLHHFNNAQKRRFVVGVAENVEALSSFQHHRHEVGIRRADAMESGIAFDINHDHFYE